MKSINAFVILATGLAAGQLIHPSLKYTTYRAFEDSSQKPLTLTRSSDPHRESDIKAGQSTKKAQDGEICPGYGEAQWTGTVDVSDERRLFYWFFDSRNDPANDPIIIWMNGGPGGSSTMGLFTEMGPCWLPPQSETPEPNPWAWNANASLLFLDQPGGVGLSSLSEGARIPKGERETAQDFQQFLNIFFEDVFPERKDATIHIAAESYGGHYGPVYVDHILESRRRDAKSAFWGNIESMILVDALLQWAAPAIGSYKLLCDDAEKIGVLNQSQCDYMATQLPEMHRLGRICDIADDARACLAEAAFGMDYVQDAYVKLVEAGKANMYNIYKKCHDYPRCSDDMLGDHEHYLNMDHVKKALGKPADWKFEWLYWELNAAFSESGAIFKPTTGDLASILDERSVSDIRVLVLNGNLDFVVNSAGQMWLYENLRWGGQAGYNLKQWQDMPEAMRTTGSWKATDDGKLAFVAVDGAGHMVPGEVREGSLRIVHKWVTEGWKMK